MSTRRWLLPVLFAVGIALPAPAFAQLDETSWGITVSVAPVWKVPSQLTELVPDTTLDIRGSDLRIGVVRGRTFGGEWGVSLVHKRLSKKSVIEVNDGGDVVSITADDAEMLGVEVHRFFSFARIGRAQIGLNLGGGIAQMRGFLTGRVQTDGGNDLSATVPFKDVFSLAGQELEYFPLARIELGVAALVGDRLKLRFGGGFNMPGIQIASVTASVLLGND
jgi:hypothetical protein